jgi:hypothetical protein
MSATSEEAPIDVTEELALQIGDLVSSKSGCFSCGGSIPMAIQHEGGGSTAARGKLNSDKKTTSQPVTIRWDPHSAQPGESRNACFPPSASSAGTGMAMLKALLQDCAPATFGRGSEDVLDESYRKASKLDSSAFSTDFCPYKLGIVNTAAELLMPGVGLGFSGAVEAELYKLNVGSPTRPPSWVYWRC